MSNSPTTYLAGAKRWRWNDTSAISGTTQRRRSNFDESDLYRPWLMRLFFLAVIAIHIQAWKMSWPLVKNAFSSRASSPSFKHLASHCADVKPIDAAEFHARQQKLAETLHALNASAYVAEPGANSKFFGNISTNDWFLSERPLLLIIAPEIGSGAEVKPRVSVLTPSFEATRARLLPIPSDTNVTFFEWPEDANPYDVAVSGLSDKKGPIFVDAGIRKFIADGLASSLRDYEALSAPLEIRSLRERKSPAELEIIRCANEVTLLAIRAVREELQVGMSESEAQTMMRTALSDAGLSNPFVLGLFGENAALPHGSGSDRILGKEDFVLFDAGGTLHGYHSDITRTFALRESTIPTEHLEIWFTVHAAQSAALHTVRNGTLARQVDEVARAVISEAGYGKFFTHRLGHGLGLEVHEEPYLRGGCNNVIRPGHVFTDEPGVYIEGKVGVRHEDSFYVSEDGTPILLTGRVGGQASSPWFP